MATRDMSRHGRRRANALGLLAVVTLQLTGCAPPIAPLPSVAPVASATEEAVVALPDAQALLPDGVAGTSPWSLMSSLPDDFDNSVGHRTPTDLADAFGAAIHASFAGGPERPELALDVVEQSDAIAMLVVTETGIGDDSVAGNQYALVIRSTTEGWRLDELWRRALCRRGVSGELCV
jgi:hypothetical protein